MKSIFTSVMIMVSVAVGFSQAPELINYQAIVRDVGGMSVANQVVGIKVSILQGSVSGPAVFFRNAYANNQCLRSCKPADW